MELGVKKVAMSQRLKPKNLTRTFYLDTKRTLDEVPFANEIPQPKPQELLDIQEKNRKQRLLDSLNKIGGRLEDTSLDFINRENFSIAGLVETKPFFNQYTGKNFSQTEINRIKKFGVEKYKKLNAVQRFSIRRGDPGKGFMTEEKKIERSKRLRPVFKGKGSKLGDTPKVVGVSGPKELKKEYINDFKKRLKYPTSGRKYKDAVRSGEILSNPQLAKKYEMTLSDVERLNIFFKKQKDLKYEKGIPASGQQLRQRRLRLNQPGTYISGKGLLQFHHIMPIGGEVELTSKDVTFLNKYMNASMQKYNTPLNRIADSISDNLERYASTKDTKFLKRIDDLNTQAAQIVDKATKELPKKYKGLIGFNKITPVLDENATLINTTVERIGIDEAKTAVGKKGPTVKLSDMSSGSYTPSKFRKEAGKVAKNIEKIIASIACPGKAMGGRIGFQDGTSCFEKGKKMINTGNIPEGAAKKNFINFANKAMAIGKQSGRGLRTITKFGVLPEAIIIGADTLIRAGSGATFDEAFKRATDFYRTDNSYEKADELELRRIDPANVDIILNLRNFRNEQAKLSSLEQAKAADLALAGTDFDEFSIGETEEEIEKRYAPQLQEQENNLFNASISDAEERAGLAKETEFEDKRGVLDKQSPIGKRLDALAEAKVIKPVVDFFATDVVREPDVGVQALANVFRDQGVSEQKIRAFEKGAEKNPDTARQLLDYFKSLDAKPLPEGTVRTDTSVADEERKILFDLAKTDPALAERLFGPSMTFAGDPIDSTDLQDEMNLDRGIYSQGGRIGYSSGSDGTALAIEESLEAFERYLKAGGKLSYKDFIAVGGEGVSKFFNSGGRVGFKDGPKNPGRRTFMKLAAGIASIPILGKFFKPAVPLVKKLANSNTVMPDWFPNFVDKFVSRSIGKKIDADLIEYTNPDLPNVKLTRKDDGSILVEGRNEYNEAYNISYEPPGYELVDETTGKAVKTPGNFEAVEGRHVALGPEDFDTDAFYADDLDELFTSDIAEMEKYTTGNVTNTAKDAFGRDTRLKKGMYDSEMAQGRAENQADILRDEGLDEID